MSNDKIPPPPRISPTPTNILPVHVKQEFTRVSALQLTASLAHKLIGVADPLRDLYTRFGLRPYEVHLVWTRWSGGKRGLGTEIVEGNPYPILPTPLVSDFTTMTEVSTPIGLDETGEIVVSQITGSLTEDFLRGHTRDGRPVNADEQLYYEIEFPQPFPTGPDGERRRFVLKGAPMYKADMFQWYLRLEKARQDRARNGDPR